MNVYKGRLLKKSSNQKSKLVLSTLVTTWLTNISFHLRLIWLHTLVAIDSESRHIISFATDLAAYFGCNQFRITTYHFIWSLIWLHTLVAIDSESRLTSFPSFCAPPSEHTPFPRKGRRFKLAALRRIRNMLFCSYVIFLLRDKWLTERLNEAMGAALVSSNFSAEVLANSIEIFISYKTKWLVLVL